jgi:hypothetical protein
MEELAEGFRAVQQGKEGYYILDVNELYRTGIIPMELRDDNFVRQKIDEYASLWDGASHRSNRSAGGNSGSSYGGGGGGGGSSSGGGTAPSGMASYNRGVSFFYPAGWKLTHNPNPQMPLLKSMITTSSGIIEVYQVDGTSDVWSGLNYIAQIYSSLGLAINYQPGGSHNGYALVSGMTTNAYGQQAGWYGAFRSKGNSVVGIVVSSTLPQAQQILSSLK